MNGTRVSINSFASGPQHDPYGGETITVERWGKKFELRSCGLRGDTLTVEGHVLFDNKYNDETYNAFELLTGASPCDWEKWYHEHLYQEDPMGSLSCYY